MKTIFFVIVLACALLAPLTLSQQSNGPLGHGTGYYKDSANGYKVYFQWNSYTNSDGWIQIYFNIPIKKEDIQVIKRFRDQIGRDSIWNARVEDGSTWIGTSNDLFSDNHLGRKYYHEGKIKILPGGGKTAELIYHYKALKRDYLDRISNALGRRIVFRVIELEK